MKNSLLRILLLSVTIFTAWEYSAGTILLGMDEKPYVYRVFVPGLARLLWLFGVRFVLALRIVVVLTALALFYVLEYLFTSFRRS